MRPARRLLLCALTTGLLLGPVGMVAAPQVQPHPLPFAAWVPSAHNTLPGTWQPAASSRECPPAGMQRFALPKQGRGVAGPVKGMPEVLWLPDDYLSPSGRHKLVIQGSAAETGFLKSLPVRHVADYGSFQVVEASSDTAKALASMRGDAVRFDDRQNVIQLRHRIIDTTLSEHSKATQEAVSGPGLWFVQFAGPVKPEWRAALDATGVQVASYYSHNAYLVYGEVAELTRFKAYASSASYVQWHGRMQSEDKLIDSARLLADKSLREGAAPVTNIYTVQFLASSPRGGDTEAALRSLAAGAIINDSEYLQYRNIRLPLSSEDLRAVAALPDVIVIEPYVTPVKLDERQNMIVAGNITGNNPTPGNYFSLLSTWGFTQAQFTASNFGVDISDSGIDSGNAGDVRHFALWLDGSLSTSDRIVYNRLIGTPNVGSVVAGCDGHGNLNAHIVGGHTGTRTAAPHADAQGYRYGLGVAPFINRMGGSVIFDPNTFTSPDFEDLQSQAYNDSMRISSNSWGAAVGGAYTTDAQRYDALVRDAQPTGSTVPVAGNQQMILLFAAGNSGSGANTVGSPATAKNVITVGASENVHPFGAADQCGVADSGADSANDMIGFSSRGPTDDGRFKPEIVAPGTHVTGGAAQAAPTDLGNGAALACFDAGGVCAGPGVSNFFPLGQQFYTASSGTSHSTPAVAGGAALVYQQFINNPSYLATHRTPAGSAPPSPAMAKAYLTNAGRHMTGTGANDTLPSNSQGMGLMDLGRNFDGTTRILRDQAPADLFTASGQTRILAGTVTDASRPFRVSLAWTDTPGPTSGNNFVNNLDLEVAIGGNTYRGNVFSGANSTTGGSADIRNNLESVFLPAGFPVGTPFTVTVRATNIAGDGVPGNASPTDQDYALVVYNGAVASVPVVTLNSATVVAGSCPANGTVADPGETLSVNISLQNVGVADTNTLSAALQNGGGVTLAPAALSYGVLSAGGAAVTRNFVFRVDAAQVCGTPLNGVLRLNDGGSIVNQDLAFSLPIGSPAVPLSENFDGLTVPNLPAGWSATRPSGTVALWATVGAGADSAPNAIFSANPATIADNRIDTPVVALPAGASAAVLSFRHRYGLENTFDGGVLEIAVGAGAFTDILAAGGSFVAGGYVTTISTGFSNPIGGRQAWTGTLSAYSTVSVNLPLSANGQNIQLRWRMGSDSVVGATGWFVDSISLQAGSTCVLGCQPTTFSVNDVSQPEGDVGTSNMVFTVSRSNPVGDQSVSFATVAGGSASTPADYTAVPPTTINFVGAATAANATVQIVGDALTELDETVFVQLTQGSGGTVLGDPDGVGTIQNDDLAETTTTTITSDNPDASVVGQPYAVAVTVAGSTNAPTGSITVTDGTDSCGPVALTVGTAPNSTATCNLTSTTAGAKTLTATYAPSGMFVGSNDTEPHQVNPAATTLALSGPATVRMGTPATYTATLTVQAPGAGTPAGTVTVSAGADSCAIVFPTATPSCSITFASSGVRSVSAAFVSGNGNYTGSTAATPVGTVVFAQSDLAVTKSNGVSSYVAGDLLVYTITLRNNGPDPVTQPRFTDVVPAVLLNSRWTCAASGGGICPQAGGVGNIDASVVTLPSGAVLTYTLSANVPRPGPASISNTAQVALPSDGTIVDPTLSNQSATDTDTLTTAFAHSFESPAINASTGTLLIPGLQNRGNIDFVAKVLISLDDGRGEALRVYARDFDGGLEYAIAIRDRNGVWTLGTWQAHSGNPNLRWTAERDGDAWYLSQARFD